MTGHARRSAGAISAPADVAHAAKRALDAPSPSGSRHRPYVIRATAAAAALCAGLALPASSPVGVSAVAAPAPTTATVSRDVDTLSRGNIDREALIPTSASASPETTTAPAPTASASTASASTAPTTAASSRTRVASSSYPACASGSAVESGLVANTVLVHRAVCTTFPDITAYGGIRGDGSEHASGHALDIMTSGARGTEIVAWLQANCSRLGIVEIIYQQRIWTTQRAAEGWRAMPDRGSTTANHYDHIHVLVV